MAKALIVLEKLELPTGKTKDLKNWLDNLKSKITDIQNKKKFLLVLDKNDQSLIRAVKNLDKTDVILADSLNCLDILSHDAILTSEPAITQIDKHYKKVSVKRSRESEIKNKK